VTIIAGPVGRVPLTEAGWLNRHQLDAIACLREGCGFMAYARVDDSGQELSLLLCWSFLRRGRGTGVNQSRGACAGIDEGAGRPFLAGWLTEHVGVDLVEHRHARKSLGAHRQFQFVGIEVQADGPGGSVLVPAVRLAPRRQVEPLLRFGCEKPQITTGH
jgi:hypothetical protein